MKKSTSFRTDLGKLMLALALTAGLTGSFAGTAQADRGGRGHDKEWNGHERQAQAWHRQHVRQGRYVQYDRYGREEAYPYVVYAPPMVVEPPSGFNIIVPLNIR